MEEPFVFIVGCARSGTTLLKRLLDAHPLLAIAPEMHWLTDAFGKGRWSAHRCVATPELVRQLAAHPNFPNFEISHEKFLRLADPTRRVRCAKLLGIFFRLYARAHGKPLVGSKTPAYVRRLPTLHALWPGTRFVHLIRDGRDVCLSVRDWDHAARIFGRFATWDSDPVSTAALWWMRKVRLGREGGSALGPALYQEARYEALVAEPAQECAELCAFLGLPYDAAMPRFHERPARTDQPGHPWGPVTVGLRDWRTQMASVDVERFEAVAGGLLEELGYPRAFPRPAPRARDHAARLREQFTTDLLARKQVLPAGW